MSEDEASEMPQAFKDTVMKTVPIIADEHEWDVQAGNHNLAIFSDLSRSILNTMKIK
jgi:hypothetical protein